MKGNSMSTELLTEIIFVISIFIAAGLFMWWCVAEGVSDRKARELRESQAAAGIDAGHPDVAEVAK